MVYSAIVVVISLLILWTHLPWTKAQETFTEDLSETEHEEESRGDLRGTSRDRQAPIPPKAADPCQPPYHRLLRNQPQRSYNYRLGSSNHREGVLCDRDLERGWYRFDSIAGNTIPTSCPGVNYCGTRAPVWMKGQLPSVEEGVVKVHGCVSVQGKCCTTQIPMLVKNCSSFVVYHLDPTPACPSAYCAGYEVPCPTGLTSESGYTPCHFPVDLLETKVSFGISKDLTQLQFFCDVTLSGHVVPDSVALEVEWLADDEPIQAETFGLVQQHKGILKEDKWTVGQTLQCRARARHTTINTFTNLITSQPFNTGINIKSPSVLTLQEGGGPEFIEFQSNIPITCLPKKKKQKVKGRSKRKDQEEEPEEEGDSCCVNLQVSTRGGNTPRCPDGKQFDLIVLSSCSFKICAEDWNTTQRIPIWAVSDGLGGGGKESGPSTVFVDLRTIDPSPPRWQELNLPQQEIHVLPGDVDEKCQTDDVTKTFDGLRYLNRLEGVFVLYKHETVPYEVQVLFRKCTARALCNCGIGIRFGDFSLAGDVCKTGKLRLWSTTAEGTYVDPMKIPHLPQILRIDEGRTFQVQFPTGTRVSFGPNLRFIRIQASGSDFGKTVGLCGSFDRDPYNDLRTYKGAITCSTNSSCDEFSKAWRLPLEQSLFQGAFEPREEDDEEFTSPGRCSCSGIDKSVSKVSLRPKQRPKFASYPYDEFGTEEAEEEPENNKCYTTTCGDPRGVDVTKQLLELVQDEDFLEGSGLGGETSIVTQLTPSFQGPRQDAKKLKDWKVEEAEIYCLRMIEGVPTTKLCRDIAHLDVDSYRMTCQREVMLTKSGSWSLDALEQLRWECRDEVYHNVSIWEPQLGRQHGTPPHGILAVLCLNNCTGFGSCHNGVCACERGWGGSDCSVNVSEPPSATHLINNGTCDFRNKPCSEVLVWGTRFAEHPQITCHFDIYRTVTVQAVPTFGESISTEGRLITYQSIICDVPELPIHDAKIASFYIPGEGLDKTRTLMRVSLSYGHGPKSGPLDYTIYDNLCWTCQGPLTCSPTPNQSCNVLSEPFGSSNDPFLNNSPFDDPNEGRGFPAERPQVQHPGIGDDTCLVPKEPGPCKKDVVRFFFDVEGGRCIPFIYGGCQGNGNNFETAESCASICGKNQKEDVVVPSSSDGLSQLRRLPPRCRYRPDQTQCTNPEVVQYYFDPERNKCRPIIACQEEADSFSDRQKCADECE